MTKDIGIDLGTANVLIHLKGRGVILNEPALVAFDKDTHQVIEYGSAAYQMIGRTGPNTEIVRPLKAGTISDYDLAEAMLTLFFDKINSRNWLSKPNVLICAPAEISELERASLIEAIERAGGGNIYIEEEAKVAAVGAGIDILSPKGAMVIDIGGGTTDIAVLSAGEIIASRSLKIAGDSFDSAIIQYFKQEKQLLIGEKSAEEAKIAVGSATHLSDKLLESYDLKGRDLVTGLPKSININSNDIHLAIQHSLAMIARACRELIEDVSPELAADIMEQGVILTGGGAMLFNLDSYLSDYLQLSVIRADQPMSCVAIGTGLMLDMIQDGVFERQSLTFKQRIQKFFRSLRRKLFG